MLVILGIWAGSSLLGSIEKRVGWPQWTGYYILVFLPSLVCCYLILQDWSPSHHYLYFKRNITLMQAIMRKPVECSPKWPMKTNGRTYTAI